MNKVVIINLGGLVFNIDEQAFQSLSIYLDKLKNKLKGQEGEKDILEDIEMRIAEIFNSKLSSSKQSITMEDAQYTMDIMGDLEEFQSEDQNEANANFKNENTSNQQNTNNINENETINKRFYRDNDRKIIGGVCSGIAAYFGVDPVIIRLLFIGLFFLWGTAFLLYIILLVIIPKALTAAQKLEMQGKPINVNNLKETFNSEYEDFKQKYKSGNVEKGLSGFLSQVFNGLTDFIASVVKFFGIAILIASIIFLIFFTIGTVTSTNFFSSLPNNFQLYDSTITTLGIICIFLLVAVPILGIILQVSVYNFKNNFKVKGVFRGLWITWILSVITLLVLGGLTIREFSTDCNIKQSRIINSNSDTLIVSSYNDEIEKNNDSVFTRFRFFRRGPFNSDIKSKFEVELNFQESEDSNFHLVIMKSSNGKDVRSAQKSMDNINYDYSIEKNRIELSRYFQIGKNQYFRNQEVAYIIEVPRNKSVFLSKSIQPIIYDIKNLTDTYDGDMLNHYWKMTKEGLDCTDRDFSERKKGKNLKETWENEDENE